MSELLHTGPSSRASLSDDGTKEKYLAFRLGEDHFAVELRAVAEILKPLPITRVPRTEDHVLGIVSVRGRLVTVMDLRRRLRARERAEYPRPRILLLNRDRDDPLGVLVDEVLQVYRLGSRDIEPAQTLGILPPPHVLGVAQPASQFLIVVSLALLLGEEGI